MCATRKRRTDTQDDLSPTTRILMRPQGFYTTLVDACEIHAFRAIWRRILVFMSRVDICLCAIRHTSFTHVQHGVNSVRLGQAWFVELHRGRMHRIG